MPSVHFHSLHSSFALPYRTLLSSTLVFFVSYLLLTSFKMGFTFDVELHTEQPFLVELDTAEYNTQTISGAIVLKLDRPESFKIVTVDIHGHRKQNTCQLSATLLRTRSQVQSN